MLYLRSLVMSKQIFLGLIGFGYFLIGIFTWYFKFFIIKLESTQAMLLGILFIIYGLFRVYRAYKTYKEETRL